MNEMCFLQSTTACCSSKRLWRDLNNASCGTRSPFAQRSRPITRNRYLNLHSEERVLRVLDAISLESETSPVHEENVPSFDWFKNWWPVQAVQNLPTDRPYRIQLLGKYYVIWKGHSGEWIAMDDECPHRLAPLSEGRIEKDGNLLCSYHAWRFDETGKCVKIPHAEGEKAHSVACNSPRSAVQTYPCKARGSLLWIWPDKSQTAFVDSEEVAFPMDDDMADYFEQASIKGIFHPYIRFVPYSFPSLMENICDPSHFNVSHHGLFPGISRYNAKPLHAKLVAGKSRIPATAAMSSVSGNVGLEFDQFEFRRPGVVSVYTTSESNKEETAVRTFLAGTPVSAGRSMVVSVGVRAEQKAQLGNLNPFAKTIKQLMVLVAHVRIQNRLFDGDSVFLHEQDKRIKQQGDQFEASKEYYVPTTADLLVMSFRKWFETEGRHGEVYGGTELDSAGTEMTRREMLDRYEQHTKHCKLCTQALKKIETFIEVLKIASFGAVFFGSVALLQATHATVIDWRIVLKNASLWASFAVGILCTFLRNYLEKNIIPMFYFEDWVHADND